MNTIYSDQQSLENQYDPESEHENNNEELQEQQEQEFTQLNQQDDNHEDDANGLLNEEEAKEQIFIQDDFSKEPTQHHQDQQEECTGEDQQQPEEPDPDDEERYMIAVHEQSSMRRQISFAIFALKQGHTVQISAFGFSVEKAVRMTEILKMRVGMLHQETNIISNRLREEYSGERRESSGIHIKLSRNQLDTTAVGYQRPKPIDETMCIFYALHFSRRTTQGLFQRFYPEPR